MGQMCFAGCRIGLSGYLPLYLRSIGWTAVGADGALAARANELAGAIASGPPLAIRFMKENINRAILGDLKPCLAMEADRLVRCARTEDHKEAVAAFLEKRKPQFRGL